MYFLIRNDEIIGYQELGVLDSDVEMIKASASQQKKVAQYGYDYYMYKDGGIEVNPAFINEKKQDKYAENDSKASEARYNQEFTITVQNKVCVFDTKQTTQADLLTAFAVCSTGETYDGWVTNNGVELDLTLEDVALISQVFKEKSNIYGKWNRYKQAIDDAKTVAEIEAIVIDYEVSNDNDI